ncbi:MAG TPA: hypothetical protein VMV59_06790, partial [Candidatus Dormibacteraeota bacterium]|nr:hypothetical protein [Candidatus Dormibacteraeota bacterium]
PRWHGGEVLLAVSDTKALIKVRRVKIISQKMSYAKKSPILLARLRCGHWAELPHRSGLASCGAEKFRSARARAI